MLVVNSRDITERKQMEEELSRSREQLRDYYTYLQSVIEMERSRIAREIHDELGQALTALNMDLDWLAKKLPEDPATLQEKINDMSKNIDVTIKSVRRIAAELRPRLLDELGLSAAIEWQAKEFCHRAGIECEVAFYPEDIVVDRERSTAIFRILQEALTNVARHAHANMVTISLVKTERKVVLKVRDNGQGITLSQIANTNSFGLLGMRERVQPWKGRVKIKGVPNKGTIVYVSLQLDT
jgi:signal transduction histidine kinase